MTAPLRMVYLISQGHLKYANKSLNLSSTYEHMSHTLYMNCVQLCTIWCDHILSVPYSVVWGNYSTMSQPKYNLGLNSVASFPFISPVSRAKKLSSKLQFTYDLTLPLHYWWKHVQKPCAFYLHTGGVSKLHHLWAKTAFTLLLEGQTIQKKS